MPRTKKGAPPDYRETLKRYGLTPKDYENISQKQGHRCAICGRPPGSKRRLAVDHDHQTGWVRGLLCSNCNLALGLFNDDVYLLHGAITYLNGGW